MGRKTSAAAYIIALAFTTIPVPSAASPTREVTRYEIECLLHPADSELECVETISWENPGPIPVDRIPLVLYLEAFRHPATVYRREGAAQGVEYAGWGGIDLREILVDGKRVVPVVGGTHCWIRLPAPLGPGETTGMRVSFTAHLPALVERTGCVPGFCFAGQWYPKVVRPAADGSWPVVPYHHNAEYDAEPAFHDVVIEVPSGWTVAATGVARRAEDAREGRSVWRFGGLLKDVAFAAGDDLAFVRSRDPHGRILEVAFPAARTDEAGRALSLVEKALPVMERRFGPYPYRTLTVVIVPRSGLGASGMEYPSLVTAPGVDPAWSPIRIRDPVLLHEISHQIYFGLLDTDEGREPWIDEGLASFAGCRLQAELAGTDVPFAFRLGKIGVDLFEVHRALLVLAGGSLMPARLAAWDYPSRPSYGTSVYSRPALVVETARRVWGDVPVGEALAGLARDHGGSRITGLDVEDSFARSLGEPFVVQYLAPALDSTAPAGLSIVSIGRGVEVMRSGIVAVPVDVEVVLSSGRREVLHWDGSGSRAWLPSPGGEKVVSALVDPGGRILVDTDRLDNGLTERRTPGAGRTLSLSGLLVLVAQIVGSLVMP